MADSAKRLAGPQQLTAAAATVYTVPAATQTIVRNVHVSNSTSAPVTFTMSIGTDAAGTRWWQPTTISANGNLVWTGFQVLNAAEVLQAYGSTASALNLTISGVEVA